MTMPLRPVAMSSYVRPMRIWMRPRRAHRGAERRSVDVGDHAAGDRQLERDRIRLAEAVVDEDDPGRAGLLRATGLRRERARAARDERDRPFSEFAGSGLSEPFGSAPLPQS